MAPDIATVQRVQTRLFSRADVTQRQMFGGMAFMVAGNILCAVGADHLMLRVGPDQYKAALHQPHAHEMRFTGRSMRGYVMLEPPGYTSDDDLDRWIAMALEYVLTLPPK